MAEEKKQNSRGTVRVEKDNQKQLDHLTELFREFFFQRERLKLYCEGYGYDYQELLKLNDTKEKLESDTVNTNRLNRVKAALGTEVTKSVSSFKLEVPKKKK